MTCVCADLSFMPRVLGNESRRLCSVRKVAEKEIIKIGADRGLVQEQDRRLDTQYTHT